MQALVTVALPVLLIFLLIRIITKPMRLIFKFLLNTAFGVVCLVLLNALSGFTGYVFAVNFLTAAVVGVLGMPGIVLLVLANFFL